VTVENNIVEQIASYGGDNFQGIDCNAGVDWIVRGNTVRDIRGAALSGSGIQFKSGSTGTVIENNLVLRCGLNGIVYGGFGNPAWGKQKYEHVGGVVRNNVVAGCADAGITVINTSDGKVVNNTLYDNGHNPDVRIVARNLEFRNNILDWPIEFRDGTTGAKLNNVVLRKPSDGSWFVNAAGADFRLRSDAPLAADLGATLSKKPSRSGGGRNGLKLGHDALARGDLAKAYRHFESAAADGGDEELVAQARDGMKKIEQAALGRLKEAQALEAIGETADAIVAYQDLLKEFAGVPASEEARQRMDALKKIPPGKK
jgi:parallel beta-helix repeat protein